MRYSSYLGKLGICNLDGTLWNVPQQHPYYCIQGKFIYILYFKILKSLVKHFIHLACSAAEVMQIILIYSYENTTNTKLSKEK